MRTALLVSACFCLARFAQAQPASDLLQSGIYAQDTLGDLNAAIHIYRQILESGPGLRLYAGQAQFRLGTCLLRKGDSAGAREAFQTVIREYSDQPALVARARESLPPGNELLRAPWSPTEVAEYRWTIPGVPEGWSICRIGPAPGHDSRLRILMNVYAPHLFVTTLDVDRNTMRPVGAGMGGNADPARFHYKELLYLLRRMPLGAGWSANIPLTPERFVPSTLKAEVTGYEEVTVPAGTFQCVRVQLSGEAGRWSVAGTDWRVSSAVESLWYGTTGARPLVKIETGRFRGELASLRTAEQLGTSSYRDPQVGYSFRVPAGWVFHPRSAYSPPGTSVDLIDPETQVMVVISAKRKETMSSRIGPELRAGAMERLRTTRKDRKTYELRGPMTKGRLGGHESLSWIADYTENGRKWVEYLTWVQSETTRSSMVVQVDAADFDRFRQHFQPILDSFRIP